jgi:hypothetical protein
VLPGQWRCLKCFKALSYASHASTPEILRCRRFIFCHALGLVLSHSKFPRSILLPPSGLRYHYCRCSQGHRTAALCFYKNKRISGRLFRHRLLPRLFYRELRDNRWHKSPEHALTGGSDIPPPVPQNRKSASHLIFTALNCFSPLLLPLPCNVTKFRHQDTAPHDQLAQSPLITRWGI